MSAAANPNGAERHEPPEVAYRSCLVQQQRTLPRRDRIHHHQSDLPAELRERFVTRSVRQRRRALSSNLTRARLERRDAPAHTVVRAALIRIGRAQVRSGSGSIVGVSGREGLPRLHQQDSRARDADTQRNARGPRTHRRPFHGTRQQAANSRGNSAPGKGRLVTAATRIGESGRSGVGGCTRTRQ